MQTYLKTYRKEPLGWVLVDLLHLSPPAVGVIFAFLYFGILLILHNIAGHPLPDEFGDVFRHPSGRYYYPNLIAVAYDL